MEGMDILNNLDIKVDDDNEHLLQIVKLMKERSESNKELARNVVEIASLKKKLYEATKYDSTIERTILDNSKYQLKVSALKRELEETRSNYGAVSTILFISTLGWIYLLLKLL